MRVDSKAEEPLTVLEEPDKVEQEYKAAVSQAASLVFPLDEAFLESGGLMHSRSARGQERESMYCYACHKQTSERCSYCLLPVCPGHGGQVQPWFTRQHVMVCTPCQARLRDIAWMEQNL